MRNKFVSVWLLSLGLLASHPGIAETSEPWSNPAFSEDPARRFDFWVGEWDVNLRTLQEDLTWQDSHRARASIYSILGGKAILELWDSQPIKGFSLRYFDTGKNRWVLWLNWPGPNRSGSSSLEGRFRHGRGEFFSTRKQPDGTELLSRYSFSDISPVSLRWDDAYSKDGGKTWSRSWIMEFSRTAAAPEWPRGKIGPTFEDGARCDRGEFRALDMLAGERRGEIAFGPDGDGGSVAARLRGVKILDGCAVMTLLGRDGGGRTSEETSGCRRRVPGVQPLDLQHLRRSL